MIHCNNKNGYKKKEGEQQRENIQADGTEVNVKTPPPSEVRPVVIQPGRLCLLFLKLDEEDQKRARHLQR